MADNTDCADWNGNVWRIPGEVRDLVLTGVSGPTTLGWTAPVDPGACPGALLYDVIRSVVADDFASATHAVCLHTDVGTESASEIASPGAGDAYFYLIRAGHVCGEGTLGAGPTGPERGAIACPLRQTLRGARTIDLASRDQRRHLLSRQ